MMLLTAAFTAHAQDTAEKDLGPCPGALGQCWPGAAGDYGYGSILEPYKRLDLSEQQWSQAKEIQEQMHVRQSQLMRQMRKEHGRLQAMVEREHADPAAIDGQKMKIADLRRQMSEARTAAISRINDLLTPEQRGQIKGSGAH